MYENENGEYVTVRTITDPETGETYKEYRTYQNNGWVRVNCVYDGCTTETYEKE